MNLSKNSWHRRLYDVMYLEAPQNLCPYFWKLVIAIIISPFVLLFNLPRTILRLFWKSIPIAPFFSDKGWAVSFVTNFSVFMVYSMTIGMLHIGPLRFAGQFGWVIVGITLLGFLVFRISEWREGKANLITEFIKAKYNNYCPKITWYEKPVGGNPDTEES